MKELLVDLIDASAAKNPKLMLRRTESVVEKMLTNWMSICMYGCLRVRPPPQPRPEAPPPQANLTSLRWWGGWGNGSLEKIWQASLLQELIAFSGRQAGGPCCPLALVLKPSLGSSVWRSFRPLHS